MTLALSSILIVSPWNDKKIQYLPHPFITIRYDVLKKINIKLTLSSLYINSIRTLYKIMKTVISTKNGWTCLETISLYAYETNAKFITCCKLAVVST